MFVKKTVVAHHALKKNQLIMHMLLFSSARSSIKIHGLLQIKKINKYLTQATRRGVAKKYLRHLYQSSLEYDKYILYQSSLEYDKYEYLNEVKP